MANILLIDAETIKETTQLHANVDEDQIFPIIENVQDIYLEPLIGTALFNRLKNGFDEGDLTTDENTLLDKYISKVLSYYTLSELPESLSMQLFSAGAVKLQSSNADGLALSDILLLAKNYKAKAEFYATRLVKYLKENASSTLFPQYLNPGNGVDTIRPEDDTYTCSIYLGD